MIPRGAALLAILVAVASLQCRKAEGVPENAIEREAEEAFVAYLRIDTTSGKETAGATYLRDLLTKNGIAATLAGADPARQAVYARLASGSPEPALLLLSHIDVVAADAERWRNPPFSGKREGGYIWGRGAVDAKSLTIAQVMSLLDLKRRGARLRRDVIFLAVPDEERGGLVGMKQLLERQPELFTNVGFVLNEGGANETAVDRVLFWGVEVQQKVPLWLRVTAEAAGGHGALSEGHGGAPAKLVRALAAIDQLETPYRLTDTVARVASLGAKMRKDHRGAALQLIREPLDIARIERELAPGYRTMLRDSITITQISAPGAVNVVPSRAFADIDIRLVAGTKPDEMLARVEQAAGTNAIVEVLVAGDPVAESPVDTELFATLKRVFTAAAPGSSLAPTISPGATDSRWFRARGITAYGIAPFKLNYYDADGVHGDNERIRARFFAEGVGVMRKIVREFCEKR
ncbi:MAG TPA: M20/M25/M40 family metallo-hydrolase [Thermoanaerobaculia bacterium]|nr:M20/M25/M40 family metallo-hydrolase [Thermoanaerobaculia bacterium]